MTYPKRRPGFYVYANYGPKAKPPHVPGTFCMEVWCATSSIAALEESVFRAREDIGDVYVSEVKP